MSSINLVKADKNERLSYVAVFDYLFDNPITYGEALFLGWISLETGYAKHVRNDNMPLEAILYKVTEDECEVNLASEPNPYRMIAGLNYLNFLKSTKGSLLPPDFEKAILSQSLKFTTESCSLAKYIACWYPGYSDETEEIEPSELEESEYPCLCEDLKQLPLSYAGTAWTAADLLNWWMLPADAPFYDMLLACSTGWDKEKSAFQINNHSWFNWNVENNIVTLINKERISRSIYTVRGVEEFFVQDPMWFWGNFLIQFVLGGGSEDFLSLLINRDATDLLTPSVVYGDVSPLNHAVNHDTVGNLVLVPNSPNDGDYTTCGFYIRNDKEIYAPVVAAKIAMDKGLPVLFQHQLEKVRVGKGAQALGKSTISVYVKLEKDTFLEGNLTPAGTLVLVDLILGQDEIDKAAKLFNRDALCVRVTPGVKIVFPEGFLSSEGENIANEMESFAASLLEG